MAIPLPRRLRLSAPLRVVLAYVVTAGLWILLSDALLERLIADHALLTLAQTLKGWLFVLATAAPFYMLVQRQLARERAHEAESRRRDALARTVLDSVSETVFMKDVAGHYRLANAALGRVMGRAVDDIIGRTDFDLHPRDVAERLAAEDARALDSDGPCESVVDVPTPIGVRRFVVMKTAHRDEHGTLIGVVGVSRDVTVQERHAAELRSRDEQLRQAQRLEAVGQLAGGVAHDFNNLLTVIGGNLDFALGDLPSTVQAAHPVRESLDEVARATERARVLVRQLLAFSRRQAVHPRPVHLGEVVTGAERMLRRLIGEDIALAVHVGAGPLVVHADPGQLEQVLMNLAVNARDAMRTPRHGHTGSGGALTIEVAEETRPREDGTDARWVLMIVRDTGHGITPDERAHLFEPFYTTKAPGHGTGLGLATAFGIVTQFGGTIEVESAAGHGATFIVRLPATAATEAMRRPAPADPGATSDAALRPAPRTVTVLLVEDEAPVRSTTRRILERRGFRVIEARHGGDALLVWAEQHASIDAMVTDLRMPEMGGRELAARLLAERATLPIVYVSGYAAEGGDLAIGPRQKFVEKPYTSAVLVAALDEVLAAAHEAPPHGRLSPAADRRPR